MSTPPHPASLDLQTNAVNLARRLGSLSQFIEAAHELIAYKNAPSQYFKRHSRKIIALAEIARNTLRAAGIQIYLFSPCPATLAPYKNAYVDLLYMLKERLTDVDPSIEARARSLLLPLSSGFKITRRGDSPSSPFPRSCAAKMAQVTGPQAGPSTSGSCTPVPGSSMSPAMMLPPDKFPSAPNGTVKDQLAPSNRRRRYWDSGSVCDQQRLNSGADDDPHEGEISTRRVPLLRPLRGRFGIFCTGKTSMHQYRDTSGARPIRPLTE